MDLGLTAHDAMTLEQEIESRLGQCHAVADCAAILIGYPRDRQVAACGRCGISASFPGIAFGAEVCNLCRHYEEHGSEMMRYFGQPADFDNLIRDRAAAGESEFDCLLLYSGGKDSTYVLFQLVAMGLRVMTFTFDNGFISKTALENIDAITARLGISHLTLTRPDQNDIFRRSLDEHKSVCNGCFRSLLDLADDVAVKHRIPTIVTGLSRGQIIDERLWWFFRHGVHDPGEIEQSLARGRQIYNLLDSGSRPDRPAPLEVELVDFYRYSDVTKDGIRALLADHPEWSQPADTGFCSSNCRINDSGVYVHTVEKGYHNYESPTRWEVRLGHLSRTEADNELVLPTRSRRVTTMLDRVGYQTPQQVDVIHGRIRIYVVLKPSHDLTEVIDWASGDELLRPGRWVAMKEIPRLNGEVDVTLLPSITDPRFDLVPLSPDRSADQPEGSLPPALLAELGLLDRQGRPRRGSSTITLSEDEDESDLSRAILAATAAWSATRLCWDHADADRARMVRRQSDNPQLRRLDLREAPGQLVDPVELTRRLRSRHDPARGVLQHFLVDTPGRGRLLVVTADQSGLGLDGLDGYIATLIESLGRPPSGRGLDWTLPIPVAPSPSQVPDAPSPWRNEPPVSVVTEIDDVEGANVVLSVVSSLLHANLPASAVLHGYRLSERGAVRPIVIGVNDAGLDGHDLVDHPAGHPLPCVDIVITAGPAIATWEAAEGRILVVLERIDDRTRVRWSGPESVVAAVARHQVVAAVPSGVRR